LVQDNIIAEKTLNFALHAIDLYKQMRAQDEFVISKQFLKAATSIGANTNEASAAQTRKDFITKMAIASKEARETKYWLTLLEKSKIVTVDCSKVSNEIDEIIRIITAIVKTAQTNEREALKEY
jgi:four helix bundle protein